MKRGAIILLLTLSACSSLVLEREQYVRIETPHADGATCYIEDKRGYHWWARSTPQVVKLDKDYGPLHVTCNLSGFYKTELVIDERYDPKVPGDFMADKIGYVLPTWLHSADQYPDTITVWMRPVYFSSLESMEEWEREFWQYLRDEEAHLVATDKTLKGYASRTYAALEKAWEEYDPPLKRVKRVKPWLKYRNPPPGMQDQENVQYFPKSSRKDAGYFNASEKVLQKENNTVPLPPKVEERELGGNVLQ